MARELETRAQVETRGYGEGSEKHRGAVDVFVKRMTSPFLQRKATKVLSSLQQPLITSSQRILLFAEIV